MTSVGNRILVPSLWLIAASIVAWSAVVAGKGATKSSHGFVSHYTASRLVIEGVDGTRLYDDAWIREQVRRFEPTVTDFYGANNPTTSLLLVPLAWIDYRHARAIWLAASFVGLAAAIIIVARQLELSAVHTPILLGLTFAFQPVQENLLRGQMYVFIFILLVAAWLGYRRRRPAMVGAGVGTLLLTKTTALMLWPLLLVERRWRALAWGAGVILAGVIISAAILGADTWAAYIGAALRLPGEAHLSVTAYQTQLGFFRHLFVYDGQWNPHPLVDLPWLGHALPVAGFAVLLAISAWRAFHLGPSDSVFAAFVLLGLVVSPVSLDYHYVLALLPIAILLAVWRDRLWSWQGWILISGTILIAADLPYRGARLSPDAWALLAYPKLYGALLLWGLALAAGERGR